MTCMSHFEWLQKWYAEQCNGEWEHHYGVTIETLDNPGWSVKIDLTGTPLEYIEMTPIKSDADSENTSDWMHCRVSENQFLGFGDSQTLSTLGRVHTNRTILM